MSRVWHDNSAETRSLMLPIMALFFCSVLSVSTVSVAGTRDILLDIVSNCVDTSANDYCERCRWPRKDSACAQTEDCRKTTEVWALTGKFAAIRDIKMCGCPSGFVHGLALPRNPVTGVEDSLRPEGIWQFAWDVARERVEPSSLALVVNPAGRRSQNQLHVHLLRLRSGLEQPLRENTIGQVKDLSGIWKMAAQGALAKGLDDYGVLVMQLADGDFAVIVTAESPEAAFTEWRCQ